MSSAQAAPGDPIIDIWYGPEQNFGVPGVAQNLYNILGRVSDDTSVTSLTYSLNGGPQLPLTIGPDTFRLQNDGDFNIDINQNALNVGTNSFDITAQDSQGNTTVTTVTLNYTPQNTWPLPLNLQWDGVAELTDAVQVVDGTWNFDSNGARTDEWGYDRIIAVGDISWTNYEITVPITVHSRDILNLGFPSIAPGLGLVARWQGHSDWQGRQPNIGYLPMGADVWYDFANNGGTFQLDGDAGTLQFDNTGAKLNLGTTYFWKFRCEGQPDGSTFYAAKIWDASQPEPAAWFLSGFEGFNDLQNGCILLIAHHVDATFGDVSVVPVGPGSTLAISNLQVTPSQNSALVTWSTNQLADSSVAYGTSNGYELGTVDAPSFVGTHNITLTNLLPSTLYHIQVTSETAAMETASSGDFTFMTLGPRTITTSVIGSGAITLTPDQPNYLDNDVVQVEAVASNGWAFVTWQGDLSGSINPTQLTVNGDMNITAVFTDNIDTNGPVISNVQVVASATSAQVTWTTDELASASVAHGPSVAYENGSVTDPTFIINHSIDLTGLTPETTYHYQVSSTDAMGNTTTLPDATFVTTSGLLSGLVSDDFSSGVLDTNVWTFINPTGNSSLSMTGTQAVITVEAGILHSMFGGGRLSPRIMQNVANADFEMEVSFESLVTQQFQTHGIVVEQDPNNYAYFDIFSNGGQMLLYVESVSGGGAASQIFTSIGQSTPIKARVRRLVDLWTFEYSIDDGANWVFGVSFTFQINLTTVGVYAGNDSFSGIDSPEYTAIIDYVFNTASPIVPEDGGNVCDGVDCSNLDGDCTVGVCNGSTGVCESMATNNGGVCDDSDPCTVNDSCSGGACVGTAKNCTAQDGPCTLGVCNATTGVCEAQPANEGFLCDDGDLCTVSDFCTNGVCAGVDADCSALDGDCIVGACNPTNGSCEPQAANEGLVCDDGDLCTLADACTNGACVGAAIDCSTFDDTCVSGSCNPATGVCEGAPTNEGGFCDDGDLCTLTDACTNGVCVGTAIDCSAFDDTCVFGACNSSTGVCESLPANEGGGCDDGDGCTINDVCSNGTCEADPLDCSGLDDACNIGTCNDTLGICEATPANESGGCDDGDLCTVNDACTNGTCAGAAKDCSSLDGPCTVGVCNPSTGDCEVAPINEGGSCDDGDLCTVTDACTSGVCVGAAMDCSGANDDCNIGACNPGTGVCEPQPANEGNTCSDGDLCTTNDACTNGVCAGDAVDCSGLDDQCVQGACNPATGACEVTSANEGNVCDDGDLCTTSDACTNGLCAGAFVDCSGFDDDCNVGICASSTGFCEQIASNEGGSCDDGDLCSESDMCADGTCAGSPVDCSAFDGECETGVCDPGTGGCLVSTLPDGTICDDGDLCTSNDSCLAGVCDGDAPDCTVLNDACNIGSCDAGTGDCIATPANEGGACDDGDGCTDTDVCASGVCAGTLADCDGDGICNTDDNCPTVANPLQTDTDVDGFGDLCDGLFDNDHDGDVDVDDLNTFVACVSGVDVSATAACQDICDADADTDVDLFDWALFQGAFTGPTAVPCP
ncbi:MAG: hypothetical protein GXP29_03880 [Planctomycetes bacterium]|nr:hypothetical protein [Planctomycetota bacterium]